MKDQKKVNQGKKNRASGLAFERKVRTDLEEKGWVVDKWTNNVEFETEIPVRETEVYDYSKESGLQSRPKQIGKLSPAKHKYRGNGIPMAMGTGFPDFICIRSVNGEMDKTDNGFIEKWYNSELKLKEVIGVEVKSNGYLKPEEKEKCRWYLDNNIFSKILIAKKGKKVGRKIEIEYVEL